MFEVPEDAGVDRLVGTVSATDPNGDAVTYEITAGNEDGKFAIGQSSGEITVAATLTYTVPMPNDGVMSESASVLDFVKFGPFGKTRTGDSVNRPILWGVP